MHWLLVRVLFFGGLLGLLAVLAWPFGLGQRYAEHAFRQHWTGRFRSCRSFEDAERLRDDRSLTAAVMVDRLKDGSWAAIALKDHMQEDWGYTVVLESTGAIWGSDEHTCGLSQQLLGHKSLTELRATMSGLRFRRIDR